MKFPLRTAVAAIALIASTPAWADIVVTRSSTDQGTLVHTNGEETGIDVTGTLGSKGPEIVHFTGDTTDAGTVDEVHLQKGNGQAELTGAEVGGNGTELLAGSIFLNDGGADNLGFDWIEFAFTGVTADSVTFTLELLGEPDFVFTDFDIDHTPNGENKWAFDAINDETILSLSYAFSGGSAESLRQVRITPRDANLTVPEPSTWAMMLLGFGAVGYSIRRRRKPVLAQVA